MIELGVWLADGEIEAISSKERCYEDRQTRSDGSYDPDYSDSTICDVVVVIRGQEMILRCRDYRQAMRWARLERKTYKIPEPDTGFPANEESRDQPLFLRAQIEIDLCSAWSVLRNK